MSILNGCLTYLDSTQGGADGKFEWWVGSHSTVTVVPEPATMLLVGTGLLGVVRRRRS